MINANTLVELLEQRAASTPNAPAYQFADEVVSYAQLRGQATALANTLLSNSVRPGDRVGILLNRGLDMVRAVYAVLYAGAAYVPIDTTSPALRAQEIARQCDLSLVITNSRCKKVFLDSATTLLLSDQDSQWQRAIESPSLLSVKKKKEVAPTDLAYIIFTSGSTGTPKGIAHSHSSAVAFAGMMAEHYELTERDVVLASSALHFDMSTFDLFAADWAGSLTVIASEAHQKMPASLTSLAENHKTTVWYSAPFAMSQALEYGALDQRNLQHMRWMIYAGEAFPIQQLNRLISVLPNCRFSNAYGPAETNVSHIYDFPWPNEKIESNNIPIGRPCKQVDTEIIDTNGNIAQEGELCIAANTLMNAYWCQDELTRSKIYCGSNGRRYYRSGDLASLDDSGLFYLLGRKDRQIKLRGFRIELEEVENSLGNITDVEQVNVAVRKDKSGRQDLVADVLLRLGSTLTAQQLRNAAKRVLPVYAVPSEIVVLSHFPTTSSGKIDRRALSQHWQEQTV
ncbi:MAG: amino acid adenylation domain-containing protein [Pseudomonadales bacterium]